MVCHLSACVLCTLTRVYMYVCNVIRGDDFRTAFKKLGGLRSLTCAPFMALSASAPSHVEKVITLP